MGDRLHLPLRTQCHPRTSLRDVVTMTDEELERLRKRIVWAKIVPHIIYLVTVGLLLFYVGYAIDRNNKRTCSLYNITYDSIDTSRLNNSDPQQRQSIRFKEELGNLMDNYGCEVK